MLTVKNQDLREFAGLDPSIYSKKKFIEFIAKYLKDEGGLVNEYNFFAGKNIKIDTVEVGENKTDVYIAYQVTRPPTGAMTQFSAEYGKTYSAESAAMTINVNRKTYPLEYVRHPGVTPPVDKNELDLQLFKSGDSFSTTVYNNAFKDGNATVMASGGSFKDTKGSSGSLTSSISRSTRHFWGASLKTDGNENFLSGDFQNNLGALPGKVTIDHGNTPSHFVIATTGNIEVLAKGMTVGLIKISSQLISPYSADPAYKKSYHIYVSTGTSTGPYTYQIKNI